MTAPVVEVNGLSKRYYLGRIGARSLRDEVERWFRKDQGAENPGVRAREFWALQDVSFEMQTGDILGIVGANGAGKSTLLKILSRITTPTSGGAVLRGRIASLLEVGTGFHPELTGRENILLNGVILGMKRREVLANLDEIIAFAQIDEFIDTPVKRYSSGMYVRLAFAVAAHLLPEILIVDEVLAVGDATFQEKCLGKMRSVAEGGRTVLFVSHNLLSVEKLCNKGLYLERGKVQGFGDIGPIVSSYSTRNRKSSRRVRWRRENAPGGSKVKLVEVELQSDPPAGEYHIEIQSKIFVHITYQTLQPNLRLRCCAHFLVHGERAFISLQPNEALHDAAGYYRATLAVNGNLLNETDYSVGVTMSNTEGMKILLLDAPECLHFEVVDEGNPGSARGDYIRPLAGYLRPKLEWRMRAVPAGEISEEPAPDESAEDRRKLSSSHVV